MGSIISLVITISGLTVVALAIIKAILGKDN